MTVHWLIQRNQGDPFFVDSMKDVLEDLGIPCHLVDLKGFSPDIPEVPGLPAGSAVVCYGPSFVPRALSRSDWQPGIFFSAETFRWSAFRTGWDGLMLSRNAEVLPLAQARTRLCDGVRLFIRPDEDSKAFDGGVHDRASLDAALDAARRPDGSPLSTDDTPVVLAAPETVEAEWRLFIVERAVVAASEYRRFGRPSTQGFVPNAAIDLGFAAVERWAPAPVFCLDIALTTDGEGPRYSIVEANCFAAARFYAADSVRIVRAVTDHANTVSAV